MFVKILKLDSSFRNCDYCETYTKNGTHACSIIISAEEMVFRTICDFCIEQLTQSGVKKIVEGSVKE